MNRPLPSSQSKQNDIRNGSKTAPYESEFKYDENGEEDISTYNYYVYYNSIKPRDPRLKKPTYVPAPDIDFIKEGTNENPSKKEKISNDNMNVFSSGQSDKSGSLSGNYDKQTTPMGGKGYPGAFNSFQNYYQIPKERDRGEPANPPYLGQGNLGVGGNMLSLYMQQYGQMMGMNDKQPFAQGAEMMGMPPVGLGQVGPMGSMSSIYGGIPGMGINQFQINPYMVNMVQPGYMQPPVPYAKMPGNGYGMGNYPYKQNKNMGNQKKNRGKNQGQQGNQQNNQQSYVHKPIVPEDAPFEEILKNLITLCKDQTGSRLMQKKLDEYSTEQKEKIVELILPEIQSLSKDVFGNYVIQKLLDSINKTQQKTVIKKILDSKARDLTLHMYGCRVIQKAIDLSDEEDLKQYMAEIDNDMRKCIEDQNGNHVIQKLIEKMDKDNHEEIFKFLSGNIYELSTHQFGCRVIQKIYNFSNKEEKQKILNEIYIKFNELCLDQYGNYVIQSILENMNKSIDDNFLSLIKGKVFEYSVHKYASNVIERILTDGNAKQIKEIVDEIIEKDNQDNGTIENVVKDRFGNYVIQKMIENSDKTNKDIIVKKILDSPVIRKKDGFCKHVMTFIEKQGYDAGTNNNQTNEQ